MQLTSPILDIPSSLIQEGHIYLVEDDDNLRSDLSGVLSQCGFTVDAYADAETFLSQATEVNPSVIVADIVLPEKSGIDLLKIVRASGRDIPIIYISGDSEPHQIIEAMKSGADDFLWKPLCINSLTSSVKSALRKDQLRSKNAYKLAEIQESFQSLTQRERQIYQLAVSGNSNLEISKLLNIQPDTAKKHRSRVMEKMNASNLAQLIECYQYLSGQN